MLRKIVKIDQDKCNGCGQCATACAEGAIAIVGGKARIVSETYCDGLGACLGKCPVDAIAVEERDAPAFDEAAAMKHMHVASHVARAPHDSACPGSMAREFARKSAPGTAVPSPSIESELTHWPIQLALVSPSAPYFKDADLLLVADCVPFAMADFHPRFLRGKPVVIGCPKLDDASFYVEKLAELLKQSSAKSLTIVHMEVPCCFGLSHVAQTALTASGCNIPVHDVTVSIHGEVKSER